MKGRNILMGIVLLTSIMVTTVVYSAFSTQLQIKGEAVVRADADIRVTNLTLKERTGNAYETYNSKYGKDTTSIYATLPANSSITYEVEITNKIDKYYLVNSIQDISHTNSNIVITKSLNVNDIIGSNSTKTFTITLTNNTDAEQLETLVTKYTFVENVFTVTFDPNGGTVSTTSKQVSYHSTYGTLPTPTRTGYTFKGWKNGNLAKEVTSSNYYLTHFNNVTSHEFKTENGTPYVRINGYPTNVDTSWTINSSNYIDLSPSTSYTLSFDVRTNASSQWISKVAQTYGHTGIYDESGNCIAPSLYNVTIPSDEQWHRYTQVITTSSTATKGIIRIGNDIPNLIGTGSYMDIANIKLEKGTTTGEWEPNYITSSTQVVQTQNHTLTADWEIKTYKVKFNANGGSGSMSDQTFSYNEEKALTSNSFTRSGYTFKGWSTKQVAAQTNLINSVTVGRNFTQNGDSFTCDQTVSAVDTYLTIGLSESRVVNTKYTFMFEASGTPLNTSLRFGYPTQQINTMVIRNGLISMNFTETSGNSWGVFDDIAKDTTAIYTFKNFALYKADLDYGNLYRNGEKVKDLLDTGTLNLYAIWEK